MDRDRLYLQKILEKILGSSDVYFQEPPAYGMKYPSIVYHLGKKKHAYANNNKYLRNDEWKIIFIDSKYNPEILEKLENLEYCYMVDSYKKDNLYHTVYHISIRR